MSTNTRCIPLGSLPYENIDSATRMIAKLFEKTLYLPFFPKIDENDNIYHRTLDKIPGIFFEKKKIVLKTGSEEYKRDLVKLDKAYNNPNKENLEEYAITTVFTEKFFDMLAKFKSPNVYINLLGPFTISQLLMSSAESQVLADKSYRKLFIQAVCVKALWMIEKIKEYSPKSVPIIMLEEPLLCRLGELKRTDENVTAELVTHLLVRVIEKLKDAGALVGVHCQEKCDWKVPINAGVDIISFDAYNNPNNLSILPYDIGTFINEGGKINWGIVPTISESIVKSLSVDYVNKRLLATMDGLIFAGVDRNKVYDSAIVSVQGDLEKLPLIFAEKALMLSTQLAKKLPKVKKHTEEHVETSVE